MIYLNAAKRIVNGESRFCCDAIHLLHLIDGKANDFYTRDLLEFKFYFLPDLNNPNQAFWWDPASNEESRMQRSLALLLMHEIRNG